MDRTELTIVAAAALMVALAFGWVLRWIYSLLNPPPPPAPKADSEWAKHAKICEAQRDEAQARLAEVEGDLGNKLIQAQAELSAAMEGLGAARRATQEMEARLAPIETTEGRGLPGQAAAPQIEEPAAAPDPAPAAQDAETAVQERKDASGEIPPDTGESAPEAAVTDTVAEDDEAEAEAEAEAPEQTPEEAEAEPEDAGETTEKTDTEQAAPKPNRKRGGSRKTGAGTSRSRSSRNAAKGGGSR